MKYTLILLFLASVKLQLTTAPVINRQKVQQQINWDSTVNWKIYKIANFKAIFRVPPDSLLYIENRPLNDDSVHHYLSGAAKLPGNQTWMGCFLLSYELADHSIRKAVISQYAGFFYAQTEHCFYKIDAEQQKEWLDYLSATYIAMPSNNK
jgi:hypothetical protein